MRIYIPASVAALRDLDSQKTWDAEYAYALTMEWQNSQEDQDSEVLEDILLHIAGDASLELDPKAVSRIVIVAECPASVDDAQEALVKPMGAVQLRTVAAVFADGVDARNLLKSGESVEGEDLMWFAAQEIPALLAEINQ